MDRAQPPRSGQRPCSRRAACLALTTAAVFAGGLLCRVAVAADEVVAAGATVVEDPRIGESSGLAASRRSADRFWTHNDSGDTARLFAITAAAGASSEPASVREVRVLGADSVDWEDIASATLDGAATLVVADTGDNARRRSHVSLYVIDEPEMAVGGDARGGELTAGVRRRIDVRYPDGPRDCEAVAIDATAGQGARRVLLISKEFLPISGIYSVPLSPRESIADGDGDRSESVVTAERIGTVALPMATGMDIRADGRQLAVTGYFDLFLFDRDVGESWEEALTRLPTHVALPKLKQVEAVCYDQHGNLWISSEGRPMAMLRVLDRGGESPGNEGK